MAMSNRAGPSVRRAGLPVALLLAALLGACADQADPSPAPAAPAATTTAAPTTAAPTTGVATTSSIPASTSARLPKPVREVKQGDRLFGVYWLATSSARLAPVERRLRALGYAPSSGDLDCDQGARRGLGAPAAMTARVAVYFGTERDARAFAEGVDVRPRPDGHAAAILYCLD
jgi:hypothetical protein